MIQHTLARRNDGQIFVTKHLDFEEGYESAQAGGWHRSGNNLRVSEICRCAAYVCRG